LALHLGYPSPRHLVKHLTSEDITYWRAYYALEPFGQVRVDKELGAIAALLYNVNREKGAEAKMWYDFNPNVDMPRSEKQQEVEDVQRSNEAAIAWVQGYNVRYKAQQQKLAETAAIVRKVEAVGKAQRR
jgi:hypothetical protein